MKPNVEGTCVEAGELVRCAERLADDDSDAIMRPLPRIIDGTVELIILVHYAGGAIHRRTRKPPHRALRFKWDGTLLEDRAVQPAEVGIENVEAPVPEFVPKKDIGDAGQACRKLLDISAGVWGAWVDDDATIDSAKLAAVYWDLHCGLTAPAVAPWYEQAAPDFFDWVRRRARAAGR